MVTQSAQYRMWVRQLSHALPCSKTALFISSVTLLCNAAVCVCVCTVGQGRLMGGRISVDTTAPICSFLVFVSAEASLQHGGALLLMR